MINRELLKALRADIDAAIQAVGAKHGVTLRTGNASFTETTASFRLHVDALAGSEPARGQTESPGTVMALVRLSKDFPEIDQASTYLVRTKRFKIVDYRPNASKNCLVVADQNGKRFVVSPQSLALWTKAKIQG